MTGKRAILADPIVNLDAGGRLVRLHCGTPGENCQLDDAKDKKTVTWAEAFDLTLGTDGSTDVDVYLCTFCFGGEGDD